MKKPVCVSWPEWFQYNLMFLVEHFTGHERFLRWFGASEKRLQQKVAARAEKMGNPNSFRIVEYQKGEYPNRLWDWSYPVVFRGAAADWPSSEIWNLDYFAKEYGDTEVTLINNPGLKGNSDQDNDQITLREYLELLKKGTNKYLKFSRLIHDNSRLRKYFDEKWLKRFMGPTSFGELYYFFIGAKGTITPIHNGFSRTIFVQVRGSKKWTFFPPEDRIFLGARPERTNYNFSRGNINRFDDPDFPLMKYASRHEVIVGEGDVIFFPPLVWHEVENLDETIGVAYKFADLPSGFYTSKIMAFLYFFSVDPPLFNSTAHLWKDKKKATSAEAGKEGTI